MSLWKEQSGQDEQHPKISQDTRLRGYFIGITVLGYLFNAFYLYKNECLYVAYRIVSNAFDPVMIFSKVVAHEPRKVSKLV